MDENVSETLIASAIRIIFKEFERYINIMKKFKGVEWSIYVKMKNVDKKGEKPKKEGEGDL